MKKPATFKFRKPPRGSFMKMASHVSIEPAEQEVLGGMVQGKEASAPEERLAKALDKANLSYQFRMVIGAPKGLPGWKELDFLVSSGGLLYAVEVDTAFTHRNKKYKDMLHDALILSDQSLRTMGELYPMVFHADGDSELADNKNSETYVKRLLGR